MAVDTQILKVDEIQSKSGGVITITQQCNFLQPPIGQVSSWGDIVGDIMQQTDLQNSFNDKLSKNDIIDGGTF
jgi:hypothetical protein